MNEQKEIQRQRSRVRFRAQLCRAELRPPHLIYEVKKCEGPFCFSFLWLYVRYCMAHNVNKSALRTLWFQHCRSHVVIDFAARVVFSVSLQNMIKEFLMLILTSKVPVCQDEGWRLFKLIPDPVSTEVSLIHYRPGLMESQIFNEGKKISGSCSNLNCLQSLHLQQTLAS